MSERPERILSADLELEGWLHLPDGAGPFAGVVVCHPHPQYGGDMHNNVVMTVCAALTAGGFAALRFNFRGVGRSGGAFDGGRGEGLDAAAAVSHLAALPAIDAARMGLAGYSFGALAALAAADARLRALALIAPPLHGVDRTRLDAFPGALLLLTGDRDQVAPEGSFRDLAASLPRAEAHVVRGADHFWWGHERELSDIIGTFFTRHLTEARAQ